MIDFIRGSSMKDTFQNLLIIIVLVLLVVGVIIIFLKNSTTKKYLGYGFAIIFITIGVFTSIGAYREITSRSYINGESVLLNKYSEQSFKYHVSQITLHEDNDDRFSDVINLDPVENFNGTKYKYEIILNDYLLFAEAYAGYIEATFEIEFNNISAEVINESILYINIIFYDNRTELTLSTYGNQSKQFIESYFLNRGFKLSVNRLGD